MTDSPQVIQATRDVRKDDIIIAFMGPTGAGKSYFIDLLTDQKGKRAGDTLKSVTGRIQATRVPHEKYGNRVVLVDTPGFDDTTRSDMEILAMISEWLVLTYKSDVKLSGLVYLHRITDNRIGGSPYRNLRMFGNLCGDLTMSRVVLVSTMWERINPEAGEKREAELKQQFWRGLIEKGSGVERLRISERREAWRIIDALIKRSEEREIVLLQEELVDLKRRLNETEAGKTLYTSLQALLAEQKNGLKALLDQLDSNIDPKMRKALEKEHKKVDQEFQKTFNEVNKLKIPLGRRIKAFLSLKKAHAKAIRMDPPDPESVIQMHPGPVTFAVPLANMKASPTTRVYVTAPEAKSNVTRTGLKPLETAEGKDITHMEDEDTNPESVRDLILDVLRNSIQGVADTVVTKFRGPYDTQVLVDYLDMILRGKTFTSIDQQNRALTLLSKLVASEGIIPKFLELKQIPHQIEPIAAGSYGSVYRGSNDKNVAIKVMETNRSSSAYIKELILWAHASHPNILPLYGVFLDGGNRIGLVSPWMSEGNLHDYVINTRDVQNSRLPLIIDVINGLLYLHQLGIVHSDLKGQNVLISSDKLALIADFGSSHIATGTATIKTNSPITYTPHFAAPEAFGGSEDEEHNQDRPTRAWDIWSFGGLCYQVLSRKPPFHGLRDLRVVADLLNRKLPKRPSDGDDATDMIDDEKWEFITTKCWAWDPKGRPTCEQIRTIMVSEWGITQGRPKGVVERPSTIPTPVNPKIDMGHLKKVLLSIQAQLPKSARKAYD